jgi:putative ATP-binding cassette transporter
MGAILLSFASRPAYARAVHERWLEFLDRPGSKGWKPSPLQKLPKQYLQHSLKSVPCPQIVLAVLRVCFEICCRSSCLHLQVSASKPAESVRKGVLISRFIQLATGYWQGKSRTVAWVLSTGFLICLVVNTFMALAINRWSKGFFDSLSSHAPEEIIQSIDRLAILAICTGLASIATTQCRMRLQLGWRLWLTATLLERWLRNGNLRACAISPAIDNPEARIADDGRIAVELLVDLAGGMINIVLVVLAVVAYSILTSFGMWILGRPLVASVEEKAAAEGDFRYALTRARHEFEEAAIIEGEESRRALDDYLKHPVKDASALAAKPQVASAKSDSLANPFDNFLVRLAVSWGLVIQGQTKVVFLTHANNLLAPIVPLMLGAPKFLAGDMSLGDLMQAAAAFLQVQLSLNWLADNALSIANWSASARRVGALDMAIDAQEIDDSLRIPEPVEA